MAWYYGTFSCGHEGRVNIIGPTKDRQWKADRQFEKMCPECWEKYLEEERQTANKEALEKAKEMELPELAGSEKQVAWANTLRQKLIEKFDNKELIDELDIYGIDITKEEVLQVRDYILENKTDARYYIDSRREYVYRIIEKAMDEALKSDEEKYMERLIKEEKIESIVYPENRNTDVAVEIEFTKEWIKLRFDKNDDFIKLVKSLGYRWDGVWKRRLSNTTGSYKDRVAEVGNKLLNEGFPVMILDEEIRNMAIAGEYEEECSRWIYGRIKGDYKGWLAINWNGYNDSLYKRARSLPGSRWDNPSVVVRIEHYKEVEEFADLQGFKFTELARQLIEEYKTTMANISTVAPTEVEGVEEVDGLEKILESNSDILEDLKDD